MRFTTLILAALPALLQQAAAQGYDHWNAWYLRLTYADGTFTDEWSNWPGTHVCHELPASRWVETGEFMGNHMADGYHAYTDRHCRELAYAFPMEMTPENWKNGDWSDKVESEVHHVGRVVGSWSIINHVQPQGKTPNRFFNEDGPKKGKDINRVSPDCPREWCQ